MNGSNEHHHRRQEDEWYQLLEIAPEATGREIQAAYERLCKRYQADNRATAALFRAEVRRGILAKIDKAYRALMEQERLGLRNARVAIEESPRGVSTWTPPPAPPVSVAPAATPAAVATPAPVEPMPQLDPLDTEFVVIKGAITGRARCSGALLKGLRESKEITLESLAQRTKIIKSHLAAMEENRFDQLPSTVYLKGYLRAYLREIDALKPELVDGYLELAEHVRKLGKDRRRWYQATS